MYIYLLKKKKKNLLLSKRLRVVHGSLLESADLTDR